MHFCAAFARFDARTSPSQQIHKQPERVMRLLGDKVARITSYLDRPLCALCGVPLRSLRLKAFRLDHEKPLTAKNAKKPAKGAKEIAYSPNSSRRRLV